MLPVSAMKKHLSCNKCTYGVSPPNIAVLRDKCNMLLLVVIVIFAFDMKMISEPKEGS